MQTKPRPGVDYWPDNFSAPPPKPWPLWLQAVLFAVVFVGLQSGWSFAQGTWLEAVAVGDWTVAPAAFWVQHLTPAVGAHAVGFGIEAPGGGIRVRNGCEGFDVVFLWLAALAVVRMPMARRALGLVWGVLAIWALNQVRIVALFYVYRGAPDLFALLHGTVAPLLLVVVVAGLFTLLVNGGAGQSGNAASLHSPT